LIERGDLIARQIELHRLVEKDHTFIQGEAQINRADFCELADGAQPGQRQRRIGTARHDELHGRRHMIDQEH
jgi:hypothetical protein